jgi:voltage-gated potassium channel
MRKLSLSDATDTFKELFLWYAVAIVIAATSYCLFEHQNIFNGIWWALVTAMTVGYGDLYPHTIGGRVTGVILMHVVPLLIIPLITARLSKQLIVDKDTFSHEEQMEIKRLLRRIDRNTKSKTNDS